MELDEKLLCDIREAAREIAAESRGLPLRALVGAAALRAPDVSLTIDLRALRTHGFPVVVARAQAPRRGAVGAAGLTSREREVAELISRGMCNKDIASALGLSLCTVKDHVHRVLRKSGCASRLELACGLKRSTG